MDAHDRDHSLREYLARLRWNVILPVGLLAVALLAVAWFDLTTGGDAKPKELVGAIGTPVRGALVIPTATPPGAEPTPRPRATAPPGVPGTPQERDATRRNDVVLLIGAFNQLKERDGKYPSTNNNIQTLCVFKELDQGCKAGEILGEVPEDPLGAPTENGYWYQSDGDSFTVYASLEEPLSQGQRCESDYEPFQNKPGLLCVKAP